jgi:hypothetical protein
MRSVGGGMPEAWHGKAGHRAQMASSASLRMNDRTARAARSGRLEGCLEVRRSPNPAGTIPCMRNDARETTGTCCAWRSRWWKRFLTTGRAQRQTLSTPSPGKLAWASLPVLILTIPNNPILQSCEPPGCHCGATQVHVFRIFRKPAACRVKGGRQALSCQSYVPHGPRMSCLLSSKHCRRSLRLLEFPFFSIDYISAGPMETPPV